MTKQNCGSHLHLPTKGLINRVMYVVFLVLVGIAWISKPLLWNNAHMPKMTVAVNAVFDLCAKRSIALYLLLSLPLRRYNGRKGQEAGGTEGSGREIDMFYSLRRWRAGGVGERTNDTQVLRKKEPLCFGQFASLTLPFSFHSVQNHTTSLLCVNHK